MKYLNLLLIIAACFITCAADTTTTEYPDQPTGLELAKGINPATDISMYTLFLYPADSTPAAAPEINSGGLLWCSFIPPLRYAAAMPDTSINWASPAKKILIGVENSKVSYKTDAATGGYHAEFNVNVPFEPGAYYVRLQATGTNKLQSAWSDPAIIIIK